MQFFIHASTGPGVLKKRVQYKHEENKIVRTIICMQLGRNI